MRLLSQMGYRADLAGNGIEAIERIEQEPYDVVLMDVQMPEMDGPRGPHARITAQWPVGKRPRIVAMTANAMQGAAKPAWPPAWTITSHQPIHVRCADAGAHQCDSTRARAGYLGLSSRVYVQRCGPTRRSVGCAGQRLLHGERRHGAPVTLIRRASAFQFRHGRSGSKPTPSKPFREQSGIGPARRGAQFVCSLDHGYSRASARQASRSRLTQDAICDRCRCIGSHNS